MNHRDPHELMRAAWAARRQAFEAEDAEKMALLRKAARDLETAASRSRETPVDHAQALHLLANVQVDLGDAARALRLWEDAIDILRGLDEPLQLAHKVRHLGDIHAQQGHLQEAEGCYSEALAIYRNHAAAGTLDFANALRRMAILREETGSDDQARALWREARGMYGALGLPAGISEADAHLANLNE